MFLKNSFLSPALISALFFAFLYTSEVAAKSVTLTTLDWPPYTGSKLPQGGATTAVIKAAFEKVGYKVKVNYLPWKRAIDTSHKGTDGAVAYFPRYHCRHRNDFIASQPLGNGPLGFAEHVDAPMSWKNVDDIGEQKLKIGTVLGYANTDEFDRKVGTGWILAVPAKNDVTNLKKLLRKRIDAVVIDKFVLSYLKATDKNIRKGTAKLRFNEKPLENKTLYLCMREGAGRLELLQEFNTGLKQIDVNKIVDNYFATAFE